MRAWRTNRGLMVSAGAHAALLGLTLVAFSRTPPFEDAQESVPVEMITTSQLNQIMKGDKTAKVVRPTPKVDKVADLAETKPLPPTPEAKRDVPIPPPPLKRIADPGEDDKPEVKPEPPKVAALPPPRPAPEPPKVEPTPPVRPAPAKVAVKEEAAPPDAEPVRPKPVERPKELAKEPPKEPPKPAPPPPKPQLRIDEVAKLLAKTPEPKAKPDAPKPDAPAAKPKSGDETSEAKPSFDLSAISKLLDRDKPARRATTGAQLQQTASLGAPTASATRMSPSMWASLAGIIADQYQRCWSQSGRSQELGYYPVVRVQLRVDGGLAASPVLTNPAADADRRALGEAAIRAVRMCDPLRIPAQYASFYAEWKSLPIKMRTED